MKLNWIYLKNIRSFLEQEIKFNNGTTLLSGDIGSGKSTVLMAICFALFGISKSNLSGNALLRNGETEGLVRLGFNLDDKEIIIERKLKRWSSVVQLSGKIIINGKEEIKSPIELKQNVLELLNYPSEYLTKSKDLIFYYTVFTPQEEMKAILLGDKELRLETLRKVFGIDKYSRINENLEIFTKILKSRRDELTGFILDLNLKESELNNLKKRRDELNLKLEPIKQDIEIESNELKFIENSIKELEIKIKILNDLKNSLEVNKKEITMRKREVNSLGDEVKTVKLKIISIEKDLINYKEIDIESLKKELFVEKGYLNNFTIKKNEIMELIGVVKTKIRSAEEIVNKIKTLDNCPLCLQQVSHTHKSNILDQQFKIIDEGKIELSRLVNELSKISAEINKKDEIILGLQEKISKTEIFVVKKKNLSESKELFEAKSKKIVLLNKEISLLETKNDELNIEVKKLDNTENEYLELKKRFETTRLNERDLMLKLQSVKSDIENNEDLIIRVEREVESKNKSRTKLDRIIGLISFFNDVLPKIVNTIEKNVMVKLNKEFNNFFQKFFSLLINIENINVKLDYEFTPQIIQNGHDIDYLHLSGGEKTALALAYRLALNKVLNTIYSTIKTNNLIILDEPTDGFSEEQLDKLRDVLINLDTEQTIIVSHESKIESFVENIIKLEKTGHMSKVV